MRESEDAAAEGEDPAVVKFLRHLAARGGSPYTERNYRQALREFANWRKSQQTGAVDWTALQRDDFRNYLRFLGRNQTSRASIQLRFAALRSHYKFLIREGVLETSPIRHLSLPKLVKRVPIFLTVKQFEDLARAPSEELKRAANDERTDAGIYFRDAAILEVIYSCGLRISELCQLRAEDIDWPQQLVRVRGKGKKERLTPIGQPALDGVETYWKQTGYRPAMGMPVFVARKETCALKPPNSAIALEEVSSIRGPGPKSDAAQVKAQLCHASPGGGSGPTQRAGAAGACPSGHNPGLYPHYH